MEKMIQHTIYLPAKLSAAVEARAGKEYRSVSATVAMIVAEGMEQ